MKTESTARRFCQFSWLATAFLGLLFIQITGCQTPPPMSVPEGSAAMKKQALSFAPPPGKAGVYVIRPYQFYNDSFYRNTAFFHVSLDYQEFGSLEIHSYLFVLVSPGKHTLGSSDFDILDSGSLVVPFTVEAGTNYYFTATGVGATRFRHFQFVPLSETDGQAYVRQFKLSGENRFELQNQPGQTQ